jgi:lipopolysaccharide biosynthesis glycosyltransferase
MEIPIVFSSNDVFVPYMSAAMQSIMENSGKNKRYAFFILHQNISDISIGVLQEQIKQFSNFSIEFIDVTIYIKNHNFHLAWGISVETYFRILIPFLFRRYEKVLYLDGDMICQFDVAELFDFDLGGNLLASSRDILGAGIFHFFGKNKKYARQDDLFDAQSSITNPDDYFLAGMLVFNTGAWTISLDELLTIAGSKKWGNCDQDFLNFFCDKKVLLLPAEYDFVDLEQKDEYHHFFDFIPRSIQDEYIKAKDHPKIIHFATKSKKPWNNFIYTPYFYLFWKYAARTPFLDIILKRMNDKNLINKSNSLKDNIISDIKNRESIGFRFLLKCFMLLLRTKFNKRQDHALFI